MNCEYMLDGMDDDYDEVIQFDCIATSPPEMSRKRRRNQPLSWEDKIHIKKLRNRIAAQTSRDRKKARMDYLEEAVKDLKSENEKFRKQIEELNQKNEELADKNTELNQVLSKRSLTCSCGKNRYSTAKSNSSLSHNFVTDDLPLRPAESYDPQRKGLGPSSAKLLTEPQSAVLWKILVLFLLSQKCFQTSQMTSLKHWQKACSLNWGNTMEKEWTIWKARCEPLAEKNADKLLKWWGKHQRTWNPVDVPI